jgi:glycosyltransferase involved in cell wall biosynthesis
LIRDGENGLLRDPYDTAGWIEATRHILDSPLFARELAERGRITVAQLTPANHAARVAEVYRTLPNRLGRAA